MLKFLFRFMLLSILVPQKCGKMLLELSIPIPILLRFLALVVVLDAMVITLSQMLFQPAAVDSSIMFVLQILSFVITIIGTYYVGRMFGGKGNFIDTIIILCWLNLIIVMFQFLQIAVSAIILLLPFLGGVGVAIQSLVTGFSLFLFFWLYVHFVKVLHSFQSALKVLGGLVLSIFAIAFAVMGFINMAML